MDATTDITVDDLTVDDTELRTAVEAAASCEHDPARDSDDGPVHCAKCGALLEEIVDGDDQPAGDPLAIAQMLLASASTRLLEHKHGGTLNDKIALGHALATFALAHAMRNQTAVMMSAHSIELQRIEQRRQAGGVTDSGIVVPR